MFLTLSTLLGCPATEEPKPPENPGEEEPAPIVYDWSDPEPTDLGDGWTLAACEGGGGPIHCLYQGDTWRGTVWYMPYDAATYPRLDGVTDREAGMDALVADYYESLEGDRAVGCAAWTFTAHEVRDVPFAGSSGRAYGFSLTDEGGVETDRNVGWLAWIDGYVHIIAVEGLGDGSCLAEEGAVLTPDELASLAPAFDRVAAGSVVPE